MNVGHAEGTFTLRGLRQSIKRLRRVKLGLESLDRSVKNNIHRNREYVRELKAKSSSLAKVLAKAKGTRQAHKAVTQAIKEQTTALKQLRIARRQLFAAKIKNIFGGRNKNVATTGVVNFRRSIQRLSTTLKNNNRQVKTWWSRFGGVAAGFWIAYRAINAVEFAISNLTRTFTSGAKMVDEYRQSVATVAGMLALLNNKTGTFQSQFERFQGVMQQTMQESIRLAPKYRLSIDEIGNAYKELAQFGVVVQRSMVDNTLNAVAMIREIAATTNGTARQVRQEIQAMFTGTTRVTDQFGKFIKRFPELEKKIFGIASANITNAEKWRLVIEEMKQFDIAVAQANETITGQTSILKKSLQVISSYAIDTSGIYQSWVDRLKEFNAELFKADGTFGPMGEKIYRIFYRVWQVINRIIKSLKHFWFFSKAIYNIVIKWLEPHVEMLKVAVKWAAAVTIVKIAYSSLLGVLKTLVAISGAGMAMKFVSSLTALRKTFTLLKPKIIAVALPLAGIVAAFTLGMKIGNQFQALMTGVFEALYTFGKPLEKLFTSIGKIFETIGYNIKEWKEKGWEAAEFKPIPDIDFSGFEEDGESMGEAFTRGYNEGLARFDAGLDNLIQMAKDKLGEFYNVVKDKVVGALSPDENNELGKAVDDLLKSLDKLLDLGDVKMPNFKQLREDIDATTDDVKSNLDEMLGKMKSMADYIGGEFKKVFSDVFSGETRKFSDLWDNILNAMVKSFEKAMADMTALYFKAFLEQTFFKKNLPAIVEGIAGYFGASPTYAGTAAQAGGTGQATVGMAGGGIIPEPVFGVGQSGQTYSFAEEGPERVLSTKDSFAQLKMPNVVVNVINKTSQEVDAKQGGIEFDGKQFVVQTILEDVERGGDLRTLLRSR